MNDKKFLNLVFLTFVCFFDSSSVSHLLFQGYFIWWIFCNLLDSRKSGRVLRPCADWSTFFDNRMIKKKMVSQWSPIALGEAVKYIPQYCAFEVLATLEFSWMFVLFSSFSSIVSTAGESSFVPWVSSCRETCCRVMFGRRRIETDSLFRQFNVTCQMAKHFCTVFTWWSPCEKFVTLVSLSENDWLKKTL